MVESRLLVVSCPIGTNLRMRELPWTSGILLHSFRVGFYDLFHPFRVRFNYLLHSFRVYLFYSLTSMKIVTSDDALSEKFTKVDFPKTLSKWKKIACGKIDFNGDEIKQGVIFFSGIVAKTLFKTKLTTTKL